MIVFEKAEVSSAATEKTFLDYQKYVRCANRCAKAGLPRRMEHPVMANNFEWRMPTNLPSLLRAPNLQQLAARQPCPSFPMGDPDHPAQNDRMLLFGGRSDGEDQGVR
jgi:hypothetical protein